MISTVRFLLVFLLLFLMFEWMSQRKLTPYIHQATDSQAAMTAELERVLSLDKQYRRRVAEALSDPGSDAIEEQMSEAVAAMERESSRFASLESPPRARALKSLLLGSYQAKLKYARALQEKDSITTENMLGLLEAEMRNDEARIADELSLLKSPFGELLRLWNDSGSSPLRDPGSTPHPATP